MLTGMFQRMLVHSGLVLVSVIRLMILCLYASNKEIASLPRNEHHNCVESINMLSNIISIIISYVYTIIGLRDHGTKAQI